MILSFIIQTFLATLLLIFSAGSVAGFAKGEKTGDAVVVAVFALLTLVVLCRYRKYRKRVVAEKRARKALKKAQKDAAFATVSCLTAEEAAETFNDEAYALQRAFAAGGTRFCCCVCEKWQPRRNAHSALYEGKQISGIVCDKCFPTFIPKKRETVKALHE